MRVSKWLGKFGKKKGFSLLELLVVISIIGILISISVVAFNTAQKKSRDAKRRGDIKAMQNAFEQYFSENITYATCSTMWTGNPGSLPTDPKGSGSGLENYNTGAGCDATGYCVCALLDSSGGGNANVPSTTNCTYATGGDYYCLTNLQ